MSVPLDRLYHFLEDQITDDIIIYRWLPHGSKNVRDLKHLRHYLQHGFKHVNLTPTVICHDQEPLDWQLLQQQVIDVLRNRQPDANNNSEHELSIAKWHLRALNEINVYDRCILLHSELNSAQVQYYQQHGYEPVYYWSHALISLDWYRYAQHDPLVRHYDNEFDHDFLIYNRAWSGSREYRLCFMQYLVDTRLESQCLTSFRAWDQDKHYTKHIYANQSLAISRRDLELHLPVNHHDSSASADYNAQDYASCGIEVILETLFDDTRIHLTEKTLRPIACGKPFLLMSTANTLQYLKHYGFETFGDVIDESYDQEQDPIRRMEMVVGQMQVIARSTNKKRLWRKLHDIAKRNQQRFFSQEFFQQICREYHNNMSTALQRVKTGPRGAFVHDRIQDLITRGITTVPHIIEQGRLCDLWIKGELDPAVTW